MAVRTRGGRRFGRSSGDGGSSGQVAAGGFAAGFLACAALMLALQHRDAVNATANRSLPGTLPPPVPPTVSSGSSTATGGAGAGSGAAEANGGGNAAARHQDQHQQQQPGVLRGELDLDLNSLPHLFLSFGNAAYFPFTHNWVKSVQAIGAPYFVAAFDEAMLDMCVERGMRCVDAKFASDKYFRGDFAAFRAMGAHKVRLVLRLLEEHPKLPLVVVADSDTVWLREPWTYFEQRPGAEFFISTDCNSHEMEERWQPGNTKTLCGHIPGNAGVAFNTGLFVARNTPGARTFLAAWADMLTDTGKERDRGRGVDDQLALNLMFEQGGIAGVGAAEPRTILVWNRKLRVQVLPVVLFSGGHVAFLQRTPWKQGVQPICIHMTFQRWWEAGKVARLREFGLWHVDPPEYYGWPPADGVGGGSIGVDERVRQASLSPYAQAGASSRFLTYENGVLGFIQGLEKQRGGFGSMVLFEKNWLGLAYQLAALRDALAVGRMLGRAVVAPTMWCWCEYDEAPTILESCINPNSDLEAPFRCPLDHLGPLYVLDERYQYVQYRNPGFLDLPQVPASVRYSRGLVEIAASMPALPFPNPAHTVGHGATIWPGIKQQELVQVVKPLDSLAVLDFRGQLPGLVGGFDDDAASAEFDDLWAAFEKEAKWCCTTWGDKDEEFRALPLARTPRMAGGWRPWQPPLLLAPDWCDKVSTAHGNSGFTRLPQHPCTFAPRSDATSAAVAEAES